MWPLRASFAALLFVAAAGIAPHEDATNSTTGATSSSSATTTRATTTITTSSGSETPISSASISTTSTASTTGTPTSADSSMVANELRCFNTHGDALDSGSWTSSACYGYQVMDCGRYDDSDFTASDMCCLCGGGELSMCVDAEGEAEDFFDEGCDYYYLWGSECGVWDDSDFSAYDMCCECGGGYDPTTSTTNTTSSSSTTTTRATTTITTSTGSETSISSASIANSSSAPAVASPGDAPSVSPTGPPTHRNGQQGDSDPEGDESDVAVAIHGLTAAVAFLGAAVACSASVKVARLWMQCRNGGLLLEQCHAKAHGANAASVHYDVDV